MKKEVRDGDTGINPLQRRWQHINIDEQHLNIPQCLFYLCVCVCVCVCADECWMPPLPPPIL